MRDIKFKAWHKLEDKMCEVEVINLDKGAFLVGVLTTENTILDDGKFEIEAPDNGRFCDFAEFELLQFTGLLDKNGIEIYKGDILDLGQTVNGVNEFIVVWDYMRIGWSIEYNAKMNMPRNYEYDVISFFKIDEATGEGVEVIGNIYENPELLKYES